MSEYLTVEPASERAPAFAAWCLGRDPRVQTVSAGGFLVPIDWYPDVPSDLLQGAFVDGFPVSGEDTPQPVVQSAEDAAQDVAEGVSSATLIGGPRTQEARKRRARKTAQSKPVQGPGYTPAQLLGEVSE